MSRPSDHANINLWQLNEDACFSRSNGKIIWQPRISAWFHDREWANIPFPGRFKGLTEIEVYKLLGCSQRVYHYNSCIQPVYPPEVQFIHENLPDSKFVDVIKTPVGEVSVLRRNSPNNWFSIVEKHWIETPEDMKLFTWLAERTEWTWRQDIYDSLRSAWGNIGAPQMFIPRVNVQHLYIDRMGVGRAIFAIDEWGDVVDDFFKVLHESHLRLINIINSSPIRIINYGDNIHCQTLSPKLYEKYVLPAYLERSEKLHKSNKFISSHWDGDVKSLLKYAKISGLDGIEAITPLPQGDVTLDEVKEALGDDVFLLDGIPAIYFDEVYSVETLIECAEKVIKLFAPKLILGISDEMSSTGDIERIDIVTKIVDDYNASLS